MSRTKADIIEQLQKDILFLQGYKPIVNGFASDAGLGPINNAFPKASFPLGAIHEFFCSGREDVSASVGFIAGILASLMQSGGVCLWISSSRTIFPPALTSFGIEPHRITFVDLQNEKEVLWAMEEALKCKGIIAVVGEMRELSFTVSRRLQLAVEKSGVTGFVIRHHTSNLNTTACLSRWKITHLPSLLAGDMPGVGFPRWNVELLKIRNGKPGAWQVEWIAKSFRHIPKIASMLKEQQKKTG